MFRAMRLVAVLLAMCAGSAFANSPGKGTDFVGQPSPAFEATDIAGAPVASAKLFAGGKVVVLNFWGLRCSACLAEMPSLNDLYDRYKDRIVLLGVNNDGIDGPFLAKQIGKMNLKINYTILPDPEMKLVDLFKMTVAPLTLVMDSKGTVRYQHVDYAPGDEKALESVVKSLLEAK
ncbi:MAG: TlpA disulfide reductase family protein [bacterium]|nr:TlpA disulfide reductase family protein [bacterium]